MNKIEPRIVTIALAVGTLLYALQPSFPQRKEETATAALNMMNYGDVDVYASVSPAQSAASGLRRHRWCRTSRGWWFGYVLH